MASGSINNDVSQKVLTAHNMNPKVRKAEYAVRGELAIRSEALKTVSLNGNPSIMWLHRAKEKKGKDLACFFFRNIGHGGFLYFLWILLKMTMSHHSGW